MSSIVLCFRKSLPPFFSTLTSYNKIDMYYQVNTRNKHLILVILHNLLLPSFCLHLDDNVFLGGRGKCAAHMARNINFLTCQVLKLTSNYLNKKSHLLKRTTASDCHCCWFGTWTISRCLEAHLSFNINNKLEIGQVCKVQSSTSQLLDLSNSEVDFWVSPYQEVRPLFKRSIALFDFHWWFCTWISRCLLAANSSFKINTKVKNWGIPLSSATRSWCKHVSSRCLHSQHNRAFLLFGREIAIRRLTDADCCCHQVKYIEFVRALNILLENKERQNVIM